MLSIAFWIAVGLVLETFTGWGVKIRTFVTTKAIPYIKSKF
jgi:hypothetical protein